MYDIEIEGKIMKVKESVLLKLSNSVQKEIDAKKEIDYSKCDLLIKKRMDCIGEVDLKYNKEK